MIRRIISFLKSKQTSKSFENKNSDILLFDENPKDINLLIGDKILEIKIHLDHEETNDWLDTSTAFLRLEQNGIICFPISGDEYFENTFVNKKAISILEKYQKVIYNTTIEDIYYFINPEEKEFDDSQMSCILLNNGYILEENRMSPKGLAGANMFCKTIEEFKTEFANYTLEIYSVKDKAKKTFN
ncbi:hypothetical protein [Flavobacterium soyae]|uniref:hypothetical protein n=1 Tax=Flavobacterium soyae TaxID=2903098 RepID=UPI001E64B3F8|nr:hypothetical protein [Flavobacterium soyae]MCD9573595.1 hypothetical protein [Flavobacterium soyae]